MYEMDRREMLRLMGIGVAATATGMLRPNFVLGGLEDTGLPAGKPNILYVFSDQQRNRAWELNNPFVKTPALKQFAAEGMVFQNCISNSPVCTPQRAMLFSGQYPRINTVWKNDLPLQLTGNLFTDVTRSHGYRNAYFGKWHLSAGRSENPKRSALNCPGG